MEPNFVKTFPFTGQANLFEERFEGVGILICEAGFFETVLVGVFLGGTADQLKRDFEQYYSVALKYPDQ